MIEMSDKYRRKKTPFSMQLEKELSELFPGVDVQKRLREYNREKITMALKLGVAGIVMAILCVGNQMMNDDLIEKKYLERQEIGGGEREVVLDAEIGEEMIEDVMIVVGEQKLSDTEKREIMNEVVKSLPQVILAENKGFDCVKSPLNLVTQWYVPGVEIVWGSSNYGIVKDDGSLGEEEISKQGTEVILTAEIAIDDLYKAEKYIVTVFPEEKSEHMTMKELLLSSVEQKERDSITEKYLELPDSLQGKSIIWREKEETSWILILGFPIGLSLIAIWGKDQEIHKQYKARTKQLLLEYSEFVSKLQLFIGSGMSTRNAFVRLADDYKKRRERGGKRRFVYEEVMMTVRRLENGMSEAEAYDYFSKRCNLPCYKKLFSIILQNEKKGMDGLMESLSVETKNAFEERKQEVKRLGEEAGTKLLLPMMMMMGVVLMIIVVPAYFSFGGI